MKLHGTIPGSYVDAKPAREIRIASERRNVIVQIALPNDPGGVPMASIDLPHEDARTLLALIETAMRRARE